mgnify:CR=1 FL=1
MFSLTGTKHERGVDRWLNISDDATQHPEAHRVYDLPFVTKYIRRVRMCKFCPVSPSFVNFDLSCRKKKETLCEFKNGKELLPLQRGLDQDLYKQWLVVIFFIKFNLFLLHAYCFIEIVSNFPFACIQECIYLIQIIMRRGLIQEIKTNQSH